MTVRIIGAEDVRRLLPMPSCIGLMRDAMRHVSAGGATQPVRSGVSHPERNGLVGVMQGHISSPDWLGVKVLTVFPENHHAGLSSHQGFVVLFETQHGAPVAIVDASAISAIRTAAATAAATEALASPEATSLAIFGYGEQAHSHLIALRHVRDFHRVIVWGRDPDKAAAFCQAHANRGIDIETASSPKDAVKAADVLCTVTAATDPIIKGDWLIPGQHVNLIGSSTPSAAEIDSEGVARGRYFVDSRDSALALAGEFKRAREAGLLEDSHILGIIGDVLTGNVVGRRSESDITIFKSLGMISEDLFAADFVYREAVRLGRGTCFEA